MSEQATVLQKEPWYNHWYVPGVIAFAGGLLIVILEAFLRKPNTIPPIIGPVSLLLSLLAFSLGWTLERHRKALQETIKAESSGLEGRLQVDLVRIASEVEEPYLLYMRDQVLRRARRPLRQLVEKSRSLTTVSDCTDELIRAINGLDERVHNAVLAVCGQKDWDSPEVRDYYEANYSKAELGVNVKRIFLQEPGKIFSGGEKEVVRAHLSDEHPNVQARVIFADQLHYLATYRFPPGFGFAILGSVVIVHWGLGKNAPEAGRRFEDPWFVEEHQRIFWRLWNHVAKGATEEEKERINREILNA